MACKIKKLLCTALAAVMTAACMIFPSYADGYAASVIDVSDAITMDDEMELRGQLMNAANDLGCNIGISFVDELYGEDISDYADRRMAETFGGDSASVYLVVKGDCDEATLVLGGSAKDRYSSLKDDILVQIMADMKDRSVIDGAYKLPILLGAVPYEYTEQPSVPSYSVVIDDEADALTTEQQQELSGLLIQAAYNAQCHIGIIIDDDLDGKQSGKAADDFLDHHFGKDSDAIVMLLTTDPDSFDWISFNGLGTELYSGHIQSIFDAVYEELDSSGYFAALVGFCDYFGVDVSDVELPSAEKFMVVIMDYDDSLTAQEQNMLLPTLEKTAASAQCNIGVVITDDLGGKTSKQYADDFADDSFGYGSNNIVLLLDNDTQYDYISSYGRGTDIVNGKTDPMLAEIQGDLKEYGYYEAVNTFCVVIDNADDIGDDYYYDYDDDYSYTYEGDIDRFIFEWAMPLGFAALIAFIVTSGFRRGYTKRKPVSARTYMDSTRTRFTHRSDVFIREYTTSHKISSSSSGGGRSGGGGRSRSGRGGGGRRR